MAIGKYQIEIKGQDFIQGISTAPDTTDGGYSPESYNVSLTNITGCIAPTFVATGNQISAPAICACDAGGNGTVDKFVLGLNSSSSSGAGTLYYQDPTTHLLSSYGTFTGQTGNLYSDMVSYLGDVYFTTQTNICLVSNSGATSGSINSTWWTSTKSQSALVSGRKHHLFVFNGILWITDGQYIHSWDGTNVVYGRLTLNSDQEIIDLGGDLVNGRLLVSFAQNVGSTFLQTKTYKYFIGSWDTSDPLKFVYPAIEVEDVVWSFIYFGGLQYVIYGTNFGYFNGAGIQFLRKLNFNQTQALQVVNKHKIAVVGPFIYFADLNQILAYGNVTKLEKVFWYPFTQNVLSGSPNILLLYKGTPTILGIGYSDSNNDTGYFDLTSGNSSFINSKFYSLQYYFPRPVYIRDVDIEFQNAVAPTGSGEAGIIYLLGDDGTQAEIIVKNSNTSANIYSLRHLTPNVTDLKGKCGRIQLQYAFATTVSVRRFIIRYDVAE